MNWTAKWITPACDMGSKAPCFAKEFKVEKKLARAILRLTARACMRLPSMDSL